MKTTPLARLVMVAYLLTLSASVLAEFRVKPYLQHPTRNGMTIMWLSNQANPGILNVADVGVFKSEPELAAHLAYYPTEISRSLGGVDPGIPYIHRIRVEGLSADTAYEYKVTQDGENFYSSFMTAPYDDVSVRFIVYADSETEPESTGTTRRWAEPDGDPNRQYVVDQTTGYQQNLMVMASRKPDFIAIAGDIVESGNEQRDWDEFWRHNAGDLGTLASSIPLFPALGNHDNYPGRHGGGGFENTAAVNQAVGKYRTYFDVPDNGAPKVYHKSRYYSLRYGPITWITLDSSNGNDNVPSEDTNLMLTGESSGGQAPDFNPGSAQYAWLEAELAQAQQQSQFTFVQFHHSPYSVGPHGLPSGPRNGDTNADNQSGQPMQALTGLFAKYGVDAVFAGHDEMYEHSEVEGIHFFDVGIGGDGLRGPYLTNRENAESVIANPHQIFLAHSDSPEVWNGPQLVSGGKHYGHMEVNVYRDANGDWLAELAPVYVFPVMDANGTITQWQRRIYDDTTVIKNSGQTAAAGISLSLLLPIVGILLVIAIAIGIGKKRNRSE